MILKKLIAASAAILITMLGASIGTARAQDNSTAKITAPTTGASLSGNVTISGTATSPTLKNYVLEFASEDTNPDQYFPVSAPVSQQVTNNTLAIWNTGTIPDGHYRLRLRVIKRDGTQVTDVVQKLTVSNRQPTQLPTPLPAATAIPPTLPPTPGPSPTPAIQQPPTSTPRSNVLPTQVSAAVLPTQDTTDSGLSASLLTEFKSLRSAFCGGIYLAIFGFIVYGVYLVVRPRLRRR